MNILYMNKSKDKDKPNSLGEDITKGNQDTTNPSVTKETLLKDNTKIIDKDLYKADIQAQ